MEGLESHIRCEPCDQWFSSDADFRAHRAEKHQAEVSLRTSDGTVVKVTRNRVSQKFVCPGECGYSTNVPRNLQRHTRTCRATGGHMRAGNVGGSRVEGGGEKETIEIALGPRDRCKSTLLSTSSLAKVHMKVSSFLGRPICDLCGVALEIASCALHLRSVHGWSSLSLDVDAELLSILKERGMDIDAERLPAPNLEIREAVEGLRLYRGAWKCLLCEKRGTGYFVPQRESMIRHLRKEHSESMEARKPSESLMVECAAIQSVFGGPRRKYFQVFPPKCLEDREDEETVTEIVKELTLSNSQLSSSSNLHPKEAPQASPSVEERQKEDEDDEPENVIDSILTQTRWHKIILNFPTDKIKLYIAGCAQRNEFEKNVSELVCTYLKIGTTRLQFNTSLHLRRKLLGEKSTSYRYFSGLQTSKCLQQYSDLACRLILMCMRRAGGITQEGKVCEFEEFPALPDEVALSALRLRKEADSSFKSRELFETSVSEIDDALCGCVFETGEQVLNRRMFLLHEILRSIFCVKFPLSEKRRT